MKNKKGFTLIELLAVIVIIGLLAVLIIPKVNKTIKDSRNNINKASVSGLIRVADNYYLEQKIKGNFQGCTYDFTNNTNTCDGLDFSGEKPEKGKLNIDKDGKISVAAKFEKKCYIKNASSDEIIVKNYDENNCSALILTAQQLEYTTTHNSNVHNVEEALDDLYRLAGN